MGLVKKELRYPLFILEVGLFISLYALAFTGRDFSFWLGGICVGQGMALTANVFDKSQVKR